MRATCEVCWEKPNGPVQAFVRSLGWTVVHHYVPLATDRYRGSGIDVSINVYSTTTKEKRNSINRLDGAKLSRGPLSIGIFPGPTLNMNPKSFGRLPDGWQDAVREFLRDHDPNRASGFIDVGPTKPPSDIVQDAPPKDGERESSAIPGAPHKPKHVFISYSKHDQWYVNELVSHLDKAGLRCWIDKSGIDYGTRWETEIKKNLDACAVFVIVMSPASEQSEWVEREILRAQKHQKTILPLLLEGEEFFGLSNIQYESVVDGRMPSERWMKRLQRLVGSG